MNSVNHPDHYNRLPHEVISIIWNLRFDKGNVIKYLMRAPFKGRYMEDLKKAQWYLHFIDDHYESYDPIGPEKAKMIDDNINGIGNRPEITYPLHLIALDFWHLARNSLDAAIEKMEAENAENK